MNFLLSIFDEVSKLHDGLQRRTLADYPDVLELVVRCQSTGSKAWLTTMNLAVMREIVGSRGKLLGRGDFFCIDGFPIKNLLRTVLPPNVRRVTGTDLIPYLCEQIPKKFGPIVFVGEQEDIARASIEVLTQRYKGSDFLHVPLVEDWSPSDLVLDSEAKILLSVRPSVVFVCLSFPKTRQWFESRNEILPAGLYIGVGSALKVAGGFLLRLPKPLRERGFEWIGRLWQEPLRLGPRYIADFFFLLLLTLNPSLRRKSQGGR